MRQDDNLAISVSAGPRAVSEALAAVREFFKIGQCDADDRAHLAIIVEELVLNIVEHGKAPEGDPIDISFSRTDDGIRLEISDGGTHFDPRDAEPPGDLPPERGGGAGIALVLAWSQILSYERRDGRNHMVLLLDE